MNARAHELLAARARRAALIRRRVVAATLSSFVLAWGVIAFHGSMGADAGANAATAAKAVTADATGSGAADATGSGAADATGSGAADATGSGAAVTAQS